MKRADFSLFCYPSVDMQAKAFAIFLIGALLSASASAESPCIECRQTALCEWQVCFASAKSDTDRATCKEQGRNAQDQCETSKCTYVFSDQEKKDWSQVLEFVKNNADVIGEVGSFKNAYRMPAIRCGETLCPQGTWHSSLEEASPLMPWLMFPGYLEN